MVDQPGSTERPDADERVVGADRVIAVLTELAEHPKGVTLEELSGILLTKKPTLHRALATLRRAGLADLVGRGVYVLGDEFIRLALRNVEGRPDNVRIQPLLDELARRYGETAHYAVLAGTDIVYRAKADPPAGAVKLTSVVGGRNPAHRTAVGKALLSTSVLSLSDVEQRFGPFPLEQKTPNTLTTAQDLFRELTATRERGFGIDDQENEVGVNCVAIPIFTEGSTVPVGAVSLSAVTFRCPLDRLLEAVPDIRADIARHLGTQALG
ncbi:IclR family transcriptional regulator [Lacisediminihabitans sp.]|uniref:IclR family transcriptional regulator n=1 Tax=Lacisediminihabitans sp. TaxID=2787631 RepID=UPI00374D70A5